MKDVIPACTIKWHIPIFCGEGETITIECPERTREDWDEIVKQQRLDGVDEDQIMSFDEAIEYFKKHIKDEEE